MQHPFGALTRNFRLIRRTAARWTYRRWWNTSTVGEMSGELEWSSLETRRDHSTLPLFQKINCFNLTQINRTVSIEKDKYMTPVHSSKTTRSSHSAQCCRYQTYSDALNNPPELFNIEIVCLLLWPIHRPQRSLGHSLFSQNIAKRFF